MSASRKRKSFAREHSLSIVSILVLMSWIVLYSYSSPSTHIGSFFGNAIADWTGVVVTVIATKFMYERGSAESRRPPKQKGSVIWERVRDHSLSIFLVATGIAWVALYISMNSESKWGQVVGNIVSEWTQLFGLVIMTKKLFEPRSKETSR
jgi:small neutral amino acid transporter SnatA (MarC family)